MRFRAIEKAINISGLRLAFIPIILIAGQLALFHAQNHPAPATPQTKQIKPVSKRPEIATRKVPTASRPVEQPAPQDERKPEVTPEIQVAPDFHRPAPDSNEITADDLMNQHLFEPEPPVSEEPKPLETLAPETAPAS
jgi:hypothetical protein